ncbi:antitermination protein Q [Dryocola sp. BD626]|uniref:antitermination protein n=1 Tax=Dryocola sp. BD626 TaxID=3133273 RepID=UPI003F4FD463
MNLESAVKYHFAKSSQINDTPRSTSSDTLTGTDVMAAMGQTQSRAAMGYSAFLGKMGISKHDSERAIKLLTEHALKTCDRVAALRKLESDIKPKVMQILAIYAYADYSRSAAGEKECDGCHGEGFIEADVFTMKTSGWGRREVKDTVRVLCQKCKGKRTLSTACNDCRGRGQAVDKQKTIEQGVPVIGNCKRCGGRGYERITSTKAHVAISEVTDAISLDTWKKSVKPFYDALSTELEIQEAYAERALKQATR